jgi:hypothetical protein
MNWFNVLAAASCHFFKGNQSGPRQWNQGIADFQLPIADLTCISWVPFCRFVFVSMGHLPTLVQAHNWQLAIGNDLSLRELEALARALLPVFLSLFYSRIARHQAGLLKRRPKVRVEFN